MQKIITILVLTLFLWSDVFASPFYCLLNKSTFDNQEQCNSSCNQIKCTEQELVPSQLSECNKNKYMGFVTINGDTFAITKEKVSYNAEKKNLAKISNIIENQLLKDLLKFYKIKEAWIGSEDKNRSTSYNTINPSRFKWQDNTELEYYAWAKNQPDNNFDTSLTGIVPIYGEHWVTMNDNGEWNDVSIYNKDQTEKTFHAIVRFNGVLSCVSGKDIVERPDNGLEGMMCLPASNDDIVRKPESCSEGDVFDIFGSTKKGYLCPTDKKECIKSKKEVIVEKKQIIETKNVGYDGRNGTPTPIDPQRKIVLSNDNKTIEIHTRSQVYDSISDDYIYTEWKVDESYTVDTSISKFEYRVKDKIRDKLVNEDCGGYGAECPTYYEGKWYNYLENKLITDKADYIIKDPSFDSHLYYSNTDFYKTELVLKYKSTEKRDNYTCPYTNRPCIKNEDNKYYCSPTDCLDASDDNAYTPNPDESEQGSNDADNNGPRDENGNCTGNLRIFPGNDNRCREPGTQNAWVQCCNVADIADADKPDITLSKFEVAAILWLTGIPWLIFFATDVNFKVCNSTERNMAVSRGHDLCVYVGSYCAEKWWLFGCVQKKQTYCCYESAFSRAFNEAGMELLGRNFGSPENPNCGGFSSEELQILSARGIAEHPKLKKFADDLGKEFENKAQSEYQGKYNAGTIKEQIENDIGKFE